MKVFDSLRKNLFSRAHNQTTIGHEGRPLIIRLSLPDAFTHRSPAYRKAWCDDFCADHLLSLVTFLQKLGHQLSFGMDFGLTGDLSVLWLLAELQGLELYTPLVLEMKNVPFEQQQQILFFILDRLKGFHAGAIDARGNGQVLAQTTQQRYGERVEQVMLSRKWYLEEMPRVKAHFEDALLILPKDADILSDIRMVKMDKGVAKVPNNARVKGRHGDSAVALALACYAAKMDTVVYAYEAVRNTDNEQHSRWARGAARWRR